MRQRSRERIEARNLLERSGVVSRSLPRGRDISSRSQSDASLQRRARRTSHVRAPDTGELPNTLPIREARILRLERRRRGRRVGKTEANDRARSSRINAADNERARRRVNGDADAYDLERPTRAYARKLIPYSLSCVRIFSSG